MKLDTSQHTDPLGQPARPERRAGIPITRLATVLLGCTLVGCLAPATATFKDVSSPVMVGPARSPKPRTAPVTPIDAGVSNWRGWSPLACGMSAGSYSSSCKTAGDESDPRELARELLRSAPQCTDCVARIERIDTGSYASVFPQMDLFFAFSKHWCAVEGGVGERTAASAKGPATAK
ncbi:MAG: hypothetical protein JW940_36355 [Polyangiaceae bacterium]|nr:hypothetical protein [Polyangiaceae bacterium]